MSKEELFVLITTKPNGNIEKCNFKKKYQDFYKEINNINNISNLLKYGIKNYRIDLLNENESQVKNIINKIRKELKENE